MCGCWVQRALRTLVNTTVHMCRPTHECPRTLRHVERFAQREVDGEPGKHVGRVGGRVDGQVDVVVQLGVEVASKAMAHCTGAPGGGGGGARGGRWAPVAVAAATMVEAAAASTAAAGGGGSSTGSTARTPRAELEQLDHVGRLKVFEIVISLSTWLKRQLMGKCRRGQGGRAGRQAGSGQAGGSPCALPRDAPARRSTACAR